MNEGILNSFGKQRVAKTLRSNCEAVLQLELSSSRGQELVLVDSESEEA